MCDKDDVGSMQDRTKLGTDLHAKPQDLNVIYKVFKLLGIQKPYFLLCCNDVG